MSIIIDRNNFGMEIYQEHYFKNKDFLYSFGIG